MILNINSYAFAKKLGVSEVRERTHHVNGVFISTNRFCRDTRTSFTLHAVGSHLPNFSPSEKVSGCAGCMGGGCNCPCLAIAFSFQRNRSCMFASRSSTALLSFLPSFLPFPCPSPDRGACLPVSGRAVSRRRRGAWPSRRDV